MDLPLINESRINNLKCRRNMKFSLKFYGFRGFDIFTQVFMVVKPAITHVGKVISVIKKRARHEKICNVSVMKGDGCSEGSPSSSIYLGSHASSFPAVSSV